MSRAESWRGALGAFSKFARVSPALKKSLQDKILVHGMVIGTCAVFELVRRRYPRFGRALESFEATYQFRAGSSKSAACRCLVFTSGRVKTRHGFTTTADYEIVLLDPAAVVKQLLDNPNDMLRLLLENKIDQYGNNYYLFKYGYLWGLCSRYFSDLAQSAAMSRIRAFLSGSASGVRAISWPRSTSNAG